MWVVTSYCVHMVYANRRVMMQPLKVGIREFRAQLPHYLLEVGEPIAVTRHGATIGYFIPTPLKGYEQMKDLSLDDAILLVESLDKPAITNPKLQNAFKQYQQK